jgi:hypothetical protein
VKAGGTSLSSGRVAATALSGAFSARHGPGTVYGGGNALLLWPYLLSILRQTFRFLWVITSSPTA